MGRIFLLNESVLSIVEIILDLNLSGSAVWEHSTADALCSAELYLWLEFPSDLFYISLTSLNLRIHTF